MKKGLLAIVMIFIATICYAQTYSGDGAILKKHITLNGVKITSIINDLATVSSNNQLATAKAIKDYIAAYGGGTPIDTALLLQNYVTNAGYGLTKSVKTFIVDTSGAIVSKTRLTNTIANYLLKADTVNIRLRPIAGTNITISGNYPNLTFAATGTSGWALNGNSINAATDYLGTTNNASIRFKSNNILRATLDTTGNFIVHGQVNYNDIILKSSTDGNIPKITVWNPTFGGNIEMGYGNFGVGGGQLALSTTGPQAISFYTNSTDRGRFSPAGNFLLGTSTDVTSSKLTISSTTQGFLPPRMTSTQRNSISSPATGLVVFVTNGNYLSFYNGRNWTGDGPYPLYYGDVAKWGNTYYISDGEGTEIDSPSSNTILGTGNEIKLHNTDGVSITMTCSGYTFYTNFNGTRIITSGSFTVPAYRTAILMPGFSNIIRVSIL
ncbi:hypothetical protein ACFOWM_06340 [Ferruginibacter yonginensis]|uniref:Uncharacterized protein n=1 Tax=Ferruginibacter yonginensis TaxID=1310416 RepID=A0ABV8QQL5_9BACT